MKSLFRALLVVGALGTAYPTERSGLNDGRVYRVSFTGDDGHGGTCTGTALVGVAHDQGGQPIPIDSGFVYDSFGP